MTQENLFHIHKLNNEDKNWQVGNVLEIGLNINYFTKFAYEFESKIRINDALYPCLNFFEYLENTDDLNTKNRLLSMSQSIISEYQILVRELGMETVRKEKFPQFPSRNRCIWLCREDQIEYWTKMFEGDFEIFQVQIFNPVFKSRNSLIPLPSDSYNDILKKAEYYWQYNAKDENEDDEYLYVGKLKIIKKYDYDKEVK